MSKVEAGLYYTQSDEWLRVEGNVGTIGITDYAQDALSDIVYVELPDPDTALDQGESFGTVESVKAASEVKMPVAGTVTAINEALEDEPEVVNGDAFGAGWFIKIAISDASQVEGLMDADGYTKFLADRD